MPALHRTIIRPLVTEQSSAAYQERGEYTFEVAPTATKPAIRQAIESLFGVKVTGVWTSNQRGKIRRVGRSADRTQVTPRAGRQRPLGLAPRPGGGLRS